MRRLWASIRADSEIFGSARRGMSELRRAQSAEAVVEPRNSIQGDRLVHHRLREKGIGGDGRFQRDGGRIGERVESVGQRVGKRVEREVDEVERDKDEPQAYPRSEQQS